MRKDDADRAAPQVQCQELQVCNQTPETLSETLSGALPPDPPTGDELDKTKLTK